MQRTMTRGLSGSDRSTASSKERAEALLNIMETIGGYPVDNLNVELDGDGRIESIYISFATRAFDTIRLGFKDKYPSLRCEASVVQNRMGANFDQEECFYTDAMGALTIKKRAGKIDDASVLIVTNQVVEKSTQRKRKGTKDL
jgi:hypothetical protein